MSTTYLVDDLVFIMCHRGKDSSRLCRMGEIDNFSVIIWFTGGRGLTSIGGSAKNKSLRNVADILPHQEYVNVGLIELYLAFA